MMNVTVMICRLTRDAEIRYSQGEKPMAVARFSVACNRDVRRENEPAADFYNCIAFGSTAEAIEKYAGTKGTQVGLEGRFQNNNWTDKEGIKHYDYRFVVNKLTFCEAKSESSQGNRQSETGDEYMSIPDGDDDLPFN